MSAAQPIPQDDICSICTNPKLQEEPKIICYGNDICLECLKVIITRVVNDKDQYPVKLDHNTVFDYSDHLDASLLEQYKLKGLEHSTFPTDRVFCYCGKFIGRLIVHREGEEYIAAKTCSDTTCQRFSCLNCATQLGGLPDIIDHGCKETRQAKEEDKQKMLESKERGTKFQLCPNCSRPIQLTEACHHIKCPCGTEFCYLCGKAASERSGHWRQGSCPRYPSQPARLPPPRPMNEQDHRDIARGIGHRREGFNERLLRIAELAHGTDLNINAIPLPPRRPEPRTPSPPPAHRITRLRLRRGEEGLVPTVTPDERVHRLRGEEGPFNEAPGTSDMHNDRPFERRGFVPGQRHEQRDHERRNRPRSPARIRIPLHTPAAVIDRDDDAMSTPTPPRAPMFPPGRAPHLPPFGHLPPVEDDFAANPASWGPTAPAWYHYVSIRPDSSHPPTMPPMPFPGQPLPGNAHSHRAPHPGFMPPPPPMPTSRPQTPVEREAEDIFARFPQPPRRWNDNDNA